MEDLFNNLRKVETQIDKVTLKKYLQYEEQHNTRLKCFKRLRIFLKLHIVNNNIHLRIDGKVINDYKNIIETKMSELLKGFYVILDEKTSENSNSFMLDNVINEKGLPTDETVVKEIQKSENIFEWINEDEKLDAFELRDNYIPKTIKIIFEFDNSKDLVRLSEPLKKVLNLSTTNKTKCIIETWKYIRLNKLIDSKGIVTANEELQAVFKKNEFHIDEMPTLLTYHYLPLDILAFNIPVNDYERIFDVVIERDDLTDFPVLYKDKNILSLDKKIHQLNEYITNINTKKNVLKKLIDNPNKFINEYLFFEKKDLDILNTKNHSGIFNDPFVQETLFDFIKNYK